MKSPHVKRSGRRRRLLLILTGALLAAAAALAAGVIYLARHPSAVKPLIEKALSAQAGATVRIEQLELGTDPLRLDARGLAVSPRADTAGFHFDARTISFRATLTGPFGARTLSIDRLRLEDYAGRFTAQFKLPSGSSGEPPSLPARWLKRLVRFFLFSDLRVQRFEALNGDLAFETPDGQARLSIATIRSDPIGAVRIEATALLAASGGRQLLELPEIQVDIAAPGLAATGPLSGRLRLHGGRLDGERFAATALSGRADFDYDRQRRLLALEGLLLQARLAAGAGKKDPGQIALDASFSADATYHFPDARLAVTRWALQCEDLLTLDGSGRLQTRPPYPFRLLLSGGRLDSARWVQQPPLSTVNKRLGLSVAGPVELRGQMEGRLGEAPDQWNGSLQASIDQMPMVVQWDAHRIEGRVGGTLQLTGSPLDPRLDAELTAVDTTLSGVPVKLEPFAVSIDAAGRYPELRANLHIRSPGVQLRTGKFTFGLRQLSVSAKDGRFDLRSGGVAFPAVAISSETLRNLSMEIDISNQGLRALLTGTDTRLAAAAADWGLIPAGWQLAAGDRIDASVIVDEQRRLLVTSRARLADLVAASPDEQTLVDGLQAAAEVNLRYRPAERRWTSVAQLSIDRGEALLGRYYHDFAAYPLTLTGRAARAAPSQQISLEGVRLQLAGLLDLQGYGNVATGASGTTATATVLVPETDLAPLARHLLVEPYKFEKPSLEKLALGGRVSGELQIANPAGSWSARGRLAWEQGLISLDSESLSAAGIELDLPVWHTAQPQDGPPLSGSLRIAAMRLPLLPQQRLQLTFKAGPDSLTTAAPVDIEFGDGTLRLGTARLTSIYSGQPQLTTSLTVEALALDPLLEKIGGVCRGGSLSGRLDRVQLTGGTLTGHGRLVADVCGGRVEILNPSVRKLFSSSPAIGFDGVIESLDLEQLTAGTSFGRIQGVLNGWVRDLQIVNGQPQAFDLLLETVRTEGVPQKINVRAVENIARLGGGGSPFMGLAGTVVSLFKEFSYSRIGVRAGLKNDTFRINGTIVEGGKEYLVKKGGLSGVDVVNLNPDNQIRFKDMIQRIQRIKTSKSGPVVE